MHLTEAVLRYDFESRSKNTNHDHPSSLLTMDMMINGLKDSPRSGK